MILYQDVAELALYRCVHREYEVNEKGSNEVTKIEYSYEFLDDYVTPQPTLAKFLQDKFTKNENLTIFDNGQAIPLAPFPSNVVDSSNLTKQDMSDEEDHEDWWLQEVYDPENHPLELMVCTNMLINTCIQSI